MQYHKIPNETIHRLPVYLRQLLTLQEQGIENLSSQELADSLGCGCYQVRKDLSYFGRFGKRGVGYTTEILIREILNILKLNVPQKAALIGIGNLGLAILRYTGFGKYNFRIVAAFDSDPKKIGQITRNITIEDIKKIRTLKRRSVKIAIVATPESAAQQIADELVSAGITSILNFAPCNIKVPKNVQVRNIDIAMELACLPFMASE
jgi:redox-sensing transcriptional repressor